MAAVADLCHLLEVAEQVGPTELVQQPIDPGVAGVAVGDGGAVEVGAEELFGHAAAAAPADDEDHHEPGHHGPQPGALALFPPARLVEVQHVLLLDVLPGFVDGRSQRGGDLPFQVRQRAGADRDAQHVPEELAGLLLRQTVVGGQRRHQGGEPGTECARGYAGGQNGSGRLSAAGARQRVQLVFGDFGRELRKLGHLVPNRIRIDAGQRRTAVVAVRGRQRMKSVDLVLGQQRARTADVALLSPTLPFGARSLRTLDPRLVGRRRLVRVRRVPTQLLFELRDAVPERVQIGDPRLDRVQLLRQTQQPLQQRAAPWTLRIDGGQILGHPALLPRPACRGITTVHAPATHT